MWRMYIKEGLHEDWLEFDTLQEALRLAHRMKCAYPWYTIKVKKVGSCG